VRCNTLAAIKDGLTRLTEAEKMIISHLPGYNDLMSALKKGRAVAIVEASCCSRKEQHELRINVKIIHYQSSFPSTVVMEHVGTVGVKEDLDEYLHIQL
jgi:hypothetical protein